MKCPYIFNEIKGVKQKPFRYEPLDVENADDTPERLHLIANDSSEVISRYFHDCLEVECACWVDCHCQRR